MTLLDDEGVRDWVVQTMDIYDVSGLHGAGQYDDQSQESQPDPNDVWLQP